MSTLRRLRGLIGGGAVGGLMLVSILAPLSANGASSLPRDCDNNSIIYCGATSPAELKAQYAANKTGDLPAIYSHYGITSSMIGGVTEANLGDIYKDGTVRLNGKIVATGANSIGREDIYHPSTKVVIAGKTYYQHVPANTFGVESIKAWIFTDGTGKFIAAILTSCANPFAATPVPQPTSSPTPKPTPTPMPTPVSTPQPTPSPTPLPTPTPTPIPTLPPTGGQVLGTSLPDTGPETALGGVAGLTAVGYATRAYLLSRKSVLKAMRGKKPSDPNSL